VSTCSKCHRPKAQTREAAMPGNLSICADVRGLGDEMAAYECDIAPGAYQRGLADRVALSKASQETIRAGINGRLRMLRNTLCKKHLRNNRLLFEYEHACAEFDAAFPPPPEVGRG
jgi:hypothetical protein